MMALGESRTLGERENSPDRKTITFRSLDLRDDEEDSVRGNAGKDASGSHEEGDNVADGEEEGPPRDEAVRVSMVYS